MARMADWLEWRTRWESNPGQRVSPIWSPKPARMSSTPRAQTLTTSISHAINLFPNPISGIIKDLSCPIDRYRTTMIYELISNDDDSVS
jgi:hypothetical protein